MEQDPNQTIPYKRGRFSTHLPVGRLYTSAHFHLVEDSPGVWRIGFTKFATRMLGDLVEYGFPVSPGEQVTVGQIIGWVEGFKALSDLYSVAAGEFLGGNPALEQDITLTDTDPYGEGWLYRIKGTPEPNSMDVHEYIALLDSTIDKLRSQSGGDEAKGFGGEQDAG